MSLRSLAVAMEISAPFLSDLLRGNRKWTEERYKQAMKILANGTTPTKGAQ